MAAAVLERQWSLLKTRVRIPFDLFRLQSVGPRSLSDDNETKLSDHEDGYFDNYFLIVFHFSRFESFCFDRKLVKVVCNGCNGRSPVWPPWQKKIRGAAHLTGFLSLRKKLRPFFSLGGLRNCWRMTLGIRERLQFWLTDNEGTIYSGLSSFFHNSSDHFIGAWV